MALRHASPPASPPVPVVDIVSAAAMGAHQVLAHLMTTASGLTAGEAASRLAAGGPNAVRSHRAQLLPVLLRQFRSPLLVLLTITAVASYFVGERADALIIGLILAASVGLGCMNEYRAEKTAEALHSRMEHQCVVLRAGHPVVVPVTTLVPGDVVDLRLGDVVPADIRLLTATGLECNESVITGESAPVEKSAASMPNGTSMAELRCAALMGSVVSAGSGQGVVTATGAAAQFGKIALGLGERQAETAFQTGLRKFSFLLVQVAAVLTVAIFVINVLLHRPVLDALLFSLAIAVGISPQLLPAVVSTSLAAGSRQLARQKVLVKRLVCIEDLGDIDVLFTDKTGTLTEGRLSFMRSHGERGEPDARPVRLGLLCSEAEVEGSSAVGGNALDMALWNSPAGAPEVAKLGQCRRLATLPFDHERRLASVLVEDQAGGRTLISKGAPEAIEARCDAIPETARAALLAEFAAGNRVVAVATRPAGDLLTLSPADERGLAFRGLLVFSDPPKASAPAALRRLHELGIEVKVVTGDNPQVSATVCAELGLPGGAPLTGQDLDKASDADLAAMIVSSMVFARVSPEQKARIVRVQRAAGDAVAFLGDGVNDALALHAADVGISVDSATDVAKDAADVILLEKDLHVLADGVTGGRRIFANTMKYVLMGTSSNFGNMFSAAGASALLRFLPMLPSQILLNNLLYDTSQLTIPTDNVDREQLARPSRWDMRFIRRFMLFFGPLSSLFDFATFGVMLWVFHAGPALFRTGWFVESLATQTLVVFAIRTRKVPFFRSQPSMPLLLAAVGVASAAAILPFTPAANALGFRPLPGLFFAVLGLMVVCYLVLIEAGKRVFYHLASEQGQRRRDVSDRIQRRSARFSTARPVRARTGRSNVKPSGRPKVPQIGA